MLQTDIYYRGYRLSHFADTDRVDIWQGIDHIDTAKGLDDARATIDAWMVAA